MAMTLPPGVTAEFAACFRRLTLAFQPRMLERDTMAVYHSVLKKLDHEDLCAGVEALLQTNTFFPTTGEWFQAAKDAELRRRRESAVYQPLQPAEDQVSPEEALRIIADLKHRLGFAGPRAMPTVDAAVLGEHQAEDEGAQALTDHEASLHTRERW